MHKLLKDNSEDFVSLATNTELMLDKLIEHSVTHLYQQYISGCDTLMIFESWAGLVPKKEFNDILIDPVNKIIKKLKVTKSSWVIINYF